VEAAEEAGIEREGRGDSLIVVFPCTPRVCRVSGVYGNGNGNGMRWWDLCGNLVGSGIDRLSNILVGSVKVKDKVLKTRICRWAMGGKFVLMVVCR
jgi:hypothetical protein